MNYPIWDVPIIGGGILIAGIAIVHVFISHFAVGAGLFNVWTERRAHLEKNPDLRGFVRTHSFVLLLVSMVLGALTGVGIWFAIGTGPTIWDFRPYSSVCLVLDGGMAGICRRGDCRIGVLL
ncbi:MAG: hypothetical protein VST68_03010 [Nitrospirota bacterium]|nr:hypothetical protein [Nitrospirota bacterium]